MDSAKIEINIESVERELKSFLSECAARAEKTGEDIFCNSKYSQYDRIRPSDAAEILLGLSVESIELHEKAFLDPSRSIAALYLNASQELADVENRHRRGPKKLGAWLSMALSSDDAM
jgi:hypothetical protein